MRSEDGRRTPCARERARERDWGGVAFHVVAVVALVAIAFIAGKGGF